MAACEYERKLNAYHDGELAPADAAGLEAHLDRCPTCRAELERLRNLSRLLGEATAAAYIPDRAMRRWRQSVRPARDRVVLRTTQMFAAVAAAVLVFCTAVLWQNWPSGAGAPGASAVWERAAVRTESPTIRKVAGQLTGEPGAAPDVQLANSILSGSTGGRNDQP